MNTLTDIPDYLSVCIGFTTSILGDSKEWNLDIWALDTDQANKYKRYILELKADIDDRNRLLILKIRDISIDHPLYQKNFFAMDIYNTVISGEARTVDEFFEWVRENRKTDISI